MAPVRSPRREQRLGLGQGHLRLRGQDRGGASEPPSRLRLRFRQAQGILQDPDSRHHARGRIGSVVVRDGQRPGQDCGHLLPQRGQERPHQVRQVGEHRPDPPKTRWIPLQHLLL